MRVNYLQLGGGLFFFLQLAIHLFHVCYFDIKVLNGKESPCIFPTREELFIPFSELKILIPYKPLSQINTNTKAWRNSTH